MKRIILEMDINAEPERVWSVLIDFASYPRWNPYQSIKGEAKLHSFVDIESRGLDGRPFPAFRSVIWKLEPNACLELLTGKIFWNASRRIFHLERAGEGTRLRHGLTISGVAANWSAPTQEQVEALRPLYEAFASALKQQVEAPSRPIDRVARSQKKRRGA